MLKFIDHLWQSFWAGITGLIASALGYFLPVKDIVHLIVIFFILDVIFGFWVANKLRGEKFSTKIIWNTTIPRMVLSLVAILGAYAWDTVFSQDVVSTYKIIGWFIAGILLFSIMKNGYKITKWEALPGIGDIIQNKIGIKGDKNEKSK